MRHTHAALLSAAGVPASMDYSWDLSDETSAVPEVHSSGSESAPGASSPPPTRGRRLVRLAWLCLPLVAWLTVITLASTNLGSEANSDPLLLRLLHLLFGSRDSGPSANDFDALSWALRKTAHLVEYAVLGLLATRALKGLFPGYSGAAIRRGGAGARREGWETLVKTAVVVLPFGAVVAAVDEFHQSFVASRTASPWDALIDVLGVLLGLTVAWLIGRRRRGKAVA